MIIEVGKQYTLDLNRDYNADIIWTIESICEEIIKPEPILYETGSITFPVVLGQPIELTSIIVVNRDLHLEYEIPLEEFISNFKEYN